MLKKKLYKKVLLIHSDMDSLSYWFVMMSSTDMIQENYYDEQRNAVLKKHKNNAAREEVKENGAFQEIFGDCKFSTRLYCLP